MPDNGLVTVASAHKARETMERLLAALKAHNMTVFARIDHAAAAAAVDLPLRPTEVVLFGNPKASVGWAMAQGAVPTPLRGETAWASLRSAHPTFITTGLEPVVHVEMPAAWMPDEVRH